MDQKFEGIPKATIRLEGHKVIRSDVTNDWGSRLQWVVTRDGKEIATVLARLDKEYLHPEKTPGKYEIVLQMWKYVNYKKDKKGEFTESKYVEISNKVSYVI